MHTANTTNCFISKTGYKCTLALHWHAVLGKVNKLNK